MTESFTEKFKKKKPETSKKFVKKSFMDHMINSRGDLCHKVVGKDSTGRVAWYFILVDKSKKEAFLKHKSGDNYDLKDYGKIIKSGYGEVVPEKVKVMLKEKYGFENIE
jgi:hypothetical protein